MDWQTIVQAFGNVALAIAYIICAGLLVVAFLIQHKFFERNLKIQDDQIRRDWNSKAFRYEALLNRALLFGLLLALLCIGLKRVPWRALAVIIFTTILIALLRNVLSTFLGLSTVDAKKRQRVMSQMGAPVLVTGGMAVSGIIAAIMLVLAVIGNFFRQILGTSDGADIAQFVWLLLLPFGAVALTQYVLQAIVMLRPTVDKAVRAQSFLTSVLSPAGIVSTWAAIHAEYPGVDFSESRYWFIPDDTAQLAIWSLFMIGLPVLIFFVANISYSTQRTDFLNRLRLFTDRIEYASKPHRVADLGRTMSNDVIVRVPRLLGELLNGDDYLLIYWFKRFPQVAMGIYHEVTSDDAAPAGAETEDGNAQVLDEDGQPIAEAATGTALAPMETARQLEDKDLVDSASLYDENTLMTRLELERGEAFNFLRERAKQLHLLDGNPAIDIVFSREQHAIRRWNYRTVFIEGLTEMMMDPFNGDKIEDIVELFRKEIEIRHRDGSDTFRKLVVTTAATALYTLAMTAAQEYLPNFITPDPSPQAAQSDG